MGKYKVVQDGEWVLLDWTKQKECCCSCGLVHVADFKVVKGQLFAKFKRDNRATAAMRSHMKKNKNPN